MCFIATREGKTNYSKLQTCLYESFMVLFLLFILIFSSFREDSDSASYRCRKYESLRCLARLSRKGDQFTKTGSEHNHGDETADIGRIAVVNTCVQRASEPRIRLKRTFEEVRER